MIVRLIDPTRVSGNVVRAHGHMMLLGFVLMTIYGVGLHVLPRLGGYPLRSERIATIQFWFANAGLPLMLTGWFFYANWLVWHGSIVVDGDLRGVGLHLFGAGFVPSLIYGLGGHMLPRFIGNPMCAGRLSWSQYLMHNAGVLILVAGFPAGATAVTIVGGILVWAALLLFSWRIWPVLWPPAGKGAILGNGML